MTECPDCNSRLVEGRCKRCGWKHENTPAVQWNTREWQLPQWIPPTKEQRQEIQRLIADTSERLKIAADSEPPRPKLSSLPKRCPGCDTGNFVHMRVRYCLSCYLALGRAS